MVVPVEKAFERNEKRCRFFGQADDLEHNGNLQSILVSVNPFIEEIAVCC